MKQRVLSVLWISLFALVFITYGAQAAEKKQGAHVLKGTVQDASGQMIEKATVYLIPAADVEAMGKTPLEVKVNSTNDEP
jgi:hypothetical protein